MDDAQLDGSLRVDRFDRIWEAFQTVDIGDEDVLHAAIFELPGTSGLPSIAQLADQGYAIYSF
jgi:hypothetical protein